MAIAPEPGQTKCPTCSSAMVPVGVTNEEGQIVQYLDCPECGHQLKEPAGASSSPSGWWGPAVSARAPAWTQRRRCPQSGPLSSRSARRALVALQQCLGEIVLVEERIDPLSNA